MSAGGQFKALYDFSGSGEGVLKFKKGDQFTLVSKTSADWWMVRAPSGEKGLVPVNYVGACEVGIYVGNRERGVLIGQLL
jgi:hypothetical protein